MKLFLKDGDEVMSPIDARGLALMKHGVDQGYAEIRIGVMQEGKARFVDLKRVDFERTLHEYYKKDMRKTG